MAFCFRTIRMNDILESPANALEEHIEAASRAPDEDVEARRAVITAFIQSRVAVLLDRAWDGASAPDENTHLQLVSDGPNRKQAMLAVFSSVERAQQFVKEHGGFEHAAEVDACWVLLGVREEQGIIINPNQQLGFRIDPEVARVLHQTMMDSLERHTADTTPASAPPAPPQ